MSAQLDAATREFYDIMRRSTQELVAFHRTVDAELLALEQKFFPAPAGAQVPGKRVRTLPERVQVEQEEYPVQETVQRVRIQGYAGHNFFVADEPLVAKGNVTELGRIVDFIMVSPSIDAQIEYDAEIKPTTPVTAGGTIERWAIRTATVHFKAVSPTLVGTMSIWVAWY